MVYPVTLTFIASDASYVCASQTTGAAGNLIINGTGSNFTADQNFSRVWMTGLGFARPVTITSASDESAVNFTITGTNIRGAALTETIAGPNANTVATTGEFYKITSVSADAAVANAVTVGIGTTGHSQWRTVDYQMTPVSIGLGIAVTGTINWTMRQTTYNVQLGEPASAAIINHPDATLVSQTVSRQGNYSVPFNAMQLVVNSSTGGSLVWDIYQAGIV